MKNLENLGVQEIENGNEMFINGGSWLGEAIGTVVGAGLRYYGPLGAWQMTMDYALSKVK